MSSVAASPPDVGVVLVAAGAGHRAGPGEPKQFRPVAGVPMLLRALRPFASHPAVAHVVVVVPEAHAARPPAWLAALTDGRVSLTAGGAERGDSVRAGLAVLPAAVTTVLVHDAARPFVSRETIDAVIARARDGIGAVAAIPLGDTLKQVADDHRIVATVPRAGLWRAQTPQGFPRVMIAAAYALVHQLETDDGAVCERAGFRVEVVPDTPRNLKITDADDFRLAEALAADAS